MLPELCFKTPNQHKIHAPDVAPVRNADTRVGWNSPGQRWHQSRGGAGGGGGGSLVLQCPPIKLVSLTPNKSLQMMISGGLLSPHQYLDDLSPHVGVGHQEQQW